MPVTSKTSSHPVSSDEVPLLLVPSAPWTSPGTTYLMSFGTHPSHHSLGARLTTGNGLSSFICPSDRCDWTLGEGDGRGPLGFVFHALWSTKPPVPPPWTFLDPEICMLEVASSNFSTRRRATVFGTRGFGDCIGIAHFSLWTFQCAFWHSRSQ